MKRALRWAVSVAGVLLALSGAIPLLSAFANEGPQVSLNIANATPREVEETTQAAVKREYANAWKAMTVALRENRVDQLGASFVGAAKTQIEQRVDQQKKTGLSERIVDRGHKLDVIFYSPEGSAMELRDTATLEKQYLDGSRVVHSEHITQPYIVVMTVAEDRWKVRVLQETKQ